MTSPPPHTHPERVPFTYPVKGLLISFLFTGPDPNCSVDKNISSGEGEKLPMVLVPGSSLWAGSWCGLRQPLPPWPLNRWRDPSAF